MHPSGVAKSSTSFGWGNGGNVTSAGWQVTLCDPMWHVSSRSSVATLRTAIHLLLTYFFLQYPLLFLILPLLHFLSFHVLPLISREFGGGMIRGSILYLLLVTESHRRLLRRSISCRSSKKGKGSPYSITERRVAELISVLGSQPAGDVSHKPGDRSSVT